MILLHGTTRHRAQQILNLGPNSRFQEPGGHPMADGFSMTLESGPFLFGTPAEYARGKSQEFPDEGGPVILAIDVPENIVRQAITEWFPISQGLIQFDMGAGLEELVACWPELVKSAQIRSVQ